MSATSTTICHYPPTNKLTNQPQPKKTMSDMDTGSSYYHQNQTINRLETRIIDLQDQNHHLREALSHFAYPCEDCNGKGFHEDLSMRDPKTLPSHFDPQACEPCETCEGIGYIGYRI